MKKVKWYILFILIGFLLGGCKVNKNQGVKFEKKDRAPESLGDLSKSLQDILKETEKIESILDGSDYEVEKVELQKAKEEKDKSDKETKGEDKQQGSSSEGEKTGESQGGQGGEQSGSGSQGNEDTEQKKPQDKDEKLLNTWESIDKKIEETHKKWNEFEIVGVKKGITQENIEKFKDSLNALTKSIEDRKILSIYDYGSQTMSNIAPMFEIYKDEIWGEINKIKYSTYQSYLKALEGKDVEASDMLKNLEEQTNKIRLKLEKNDSKIKMLDNINLSIMDMKKALNEKSIKLTRIKKDIIIKNLEELGK